MLQICSACIKQFEINFFNPMTTLEFSWSCAQGRRPQPGTGKPGNCPPRNFCEDDAIHVLHMKSYFLRLRYLYVNFFSRQLCRIRAASYWIKLLTSQCTMLPKTPNTEPETSCEALVVKWNQSRRHGGLWWAYPPKQSSKHPQIETRNVINQCNFCQLWMSNLPAQTQSPPIDDFLATVLRENIRFMKVTLWL